MDGARPPTEPTEEQVQEVHRRGLRSHRWAVTALVVVSLVVAAAGTARLLPLLPDDAAGTRPVGEITVVPSPSAVSATVDARSPHSAQPAPEPRVFLGGIGGGSERTAVISVATGTVLRYLSPPPGSPALGVLSPDRRIWFEPAGEGPCGSSWRAITVSSGVITPALAGESGIETFALSPDGRQLALVKGRPPSGPACQALEPPDPGCKVSLPRFRAGSGGLVVAEHCDADGGSSQGRALLEYDPARGRLVRTLARVPGDAMITDLSVDASGQHVLVLLFPTSSSEATAYALRKGRLQRVFRGAFTASW